MRNEINKLKETLSNVIIALNELESEINEVKYEPKVLIPKGSIVVWDYSRKYYSAIGGAKAIVIEDYKEDQDTIKVEWIDDERRNNQENGGYFIDMFREEFELPKEEVAPTYQCENKDTFDKVKQVIQLLKTLDNGDCVDGETMQYILEQVGMENQMLNQLITNSQL